MELIMKQKVWEGDSTKSLDTHGELMLESQALNNSVGLPTSEIDNRTLVS
jgi:hypothetical protein